MASTVWRGHLAFGLVSFPVRLYRAARAEKVSLRRLYRPAAAQEEPEYEPEPELEPEPPPPPPSRSKLHAIPAPPPPVEQKPAPPTVTPVFQTHNTITADADKAVSSSELVKGFEFEKGQYVVLEEAELRSITPQTSKEMQIVEFVRLNEIDPVFLETSYYLVPDGPGERPYTLLLQSLRETGYVGLAQLAMHRREHVIIIRSGPSGIIAHTMFYPDEVRQSQEFRPDASALVPRELDLAKRLIEAMVVPFEPSKFRDTYRERLNEMIASKVDGQRIAREPSAPKKAAAVMDIMKALQESLNLAKKPPVSAPAAAPSTKAAGSTRKL